LTNQPFLASLQSECSVGDAGPSEQEISYTNLFNDVRTAIDFVHQRGTLKVKTLADIERYVERDDRTATMLHRLRQSGKKVLAYTLLLTRVV
jgi:5'-nucleotidase